MDTFVGTPNYLSPEVIKTEKHTLAIDVWAIGNILYKMIFGKVAFPGRNKMLVYDTICKRQMETSIGSYLENSWHFLVLIRNQKLRMAILYIVQKLISRTSENTISKQSSGSIRKYIPLIDSPMLDSVITIYFLQMVHVLHSIY